MFDIGIGEIMMLAVVGLLVFGPERLPRAAADAGRWVRTLREMAAGARKDLADSAGVDFTEAFDSMRELKDLHPRNLAAGLMEGPATKPKTAPPAGSNGSTEPRFDPDAL